VVIAKWTSSLFFVEEMPEILGLDTLYHALLIVLLTVP
jgi:hypothetical protein